MYSDDFSYVIYRLRLEARWHDGRPVTPGDVIFSFEAFRKLHPQLAAYYRHVVKAVQTGERDITFWFDQPSNRELPQIVGQLNILPQHWWEGVDTAGNKRDVAATTLENRCLVVGLPARRPCSPFHERTPPGQTTDAKDKELPVPRSGGRYVVELYNETRTHLSLDKDAPVSRAIQTVGRIFARQVLGGLHHQYVRI